MNEVVFENTVDGLFHRGLGGRLSRTAKDRMRRVGLDLELKLNPAYPREIYYECVRIAAADIYPKLSPDEAYYQLGQDFMRGYETTFLGRALLSVIRIIGPKRSLQRMTHNLHSANNYMDTKLTEMGPSRFELWVNQTSGMPTYLQGVFQYALTIAGAKDLVVTIARREDAGCTYSVSWGQTKAPN
jgi:uncharacterized protein (TIGR02265 family)